MANSYVNYVGNGALTNYTVPFSYLDQSHIHVQVNGVDQAFTWFSSTQVRLAVTNGQVFTVKRITPIDTPLVDYSNGNVLTETDLDTSALQTLFAVQEQEDVVETLSDTIDALAISAGAVPVPANPTDNGKVLTASGGVYSWGLVALSSITGLAAWALTFLGQASGGAALSNIGGAPRSRVLTAGAGLSGGGDLTNDRTFALDTSGVTSGSYVAPTVTVDAYGRATAASDNAAAIARAWVNFNGTGTVAIRNSYGVTSITDNGTGNYTVNLTTSRGDANYCAIVAGMDSGSTATDVIGYPTSASAVQVHGMNRVTQVLADVNNVNVVVFDT